MPSQLPLPLPRMGAKIFVIFLPQQFPVDLQLFSFFPFFIVFPSKALDASQLFSI
jgi:hypothetical protein